MNNKRTITTREQFPKLMGKFVREQQPYIVTGALWVLKPFA